MKTSALILVFLSFVIWTGSVGSAYAGGETWNEREGASLQLDQFNTPTGIVYNDEYYDIKRLISEKDLPRIAPAAGFVEDMENSNPQAMSIHMTEDLYFE